MNPPDWILAAAKAYFVNDGNSAEELAKHFTRYLPGRPAQVAPVYRPLTGSDVIVPGDEFKLRSLPDEHWGPCDLFTDSKVSDVHEKGRIEFRRRI